MSFRLFVYCCSLCGGWAALVGWMLGRMTAGPQPIASAGIKAMFLGMLVALALGIVDAVWNFSRGQILQMLPRVVTSVVVGTIGGLIGGVIGQLLFSLLSWLFIAGWVITGLLVGVSLGAFDVLIRFVRHEDLRGVQRKILRGVLGGMVGGLLGGVLSLLLHKVFSGVLASKPEDQLWSPSAMGFVALGLCIGLMIGLAQILFKESWIRVEAGFRRGRELILAKPEISIGRAETCDIGVFGDAAVERLHARLVQQEDGYVLTDAGSASGTFVNDQRVDQPIHLRSGDSIRVGSTVLRFGQRQKETK